MGQLSGKIAIITGAGTGIGKGMARAFATGRRGPRPRLAQPRQPRPDGPGTGRQRRQHPRRPHGRHRRDRPWTHCSKPPCRSSAESTSSSTTPAPSTAARSTNCRLETWLKVLAVNLTGPFLCGREAMRIMKAQGGGRIINVGSISAQMCRPNAAPYNTTKHGLVGLTKSMALEGREYNIVASMLHPGNVLTERRAASDRIAGRRAHDDRGRTRRGRRHHGALPLHVNVLEAIVLPTTQKYLGRG